MLIMTYAYARATGDGSLISRYVRTKPIGYYWRTNKTEQYSLLTSWANYLSDSTLLNHDECVVSFDDSFC